jgi:N-acetylneuraminic acid mutarotase
VLGLGLLLGIVGLLVVVVSPLVRGPGPTPSPAAKAAAEGGGRWRELAPLPEPRAGFAFASYAYEGRQYLYVIGGARGAASSSQVLRYDSSADLWVPMSAKPTAVTDVRAAVVGGRIYVPGGHLESGAIGGQLEVYDPRRDRWATLAPLPAPRSGYALAAVEGKLYLFGGWDGTTYRSDVWQYNPDDDTWHPRTPMPTARAFPSAAVLDQQVYVVGGENGDGKLSTNERYSPAVDGAGAEPWSTKAPTSVPLDHSDAAVAGGLMMLVGADSAIGRLLVYNPQVDSWDSSQIPFPPLRDARVQSIVGKLYIAGGGDASGASARVYEYRAISTVFVPAVQ